MNDAKVSWDGSAMCSRRVCDICRSLSYPTVRLRMDFRDPNTIGTFVYHCHLMEHSEGGMMGMIRVGPPAPAASRTSEHGRSDLSRRHDTVRQ
jgi:multicopper oxidase